MYADTLVMDKQFKKASKLFYALCQKYNKWKVKKLALGRKLF